MLATDSRQPLAHMYLGQVLFERGQPAEAEKAFRASLAVDPNFGAPHFYLGQLYESQDRKKDALREYREAVARQADLAPAVGGGEAARGAGPRRGRHPRAAPARAGPR